MLFASFEVMSASKINSLGVFAQTGATQPIFVLHLLAQTRENQMAFAQTGATSRVFCSKLFTSASIINLSGFSLRQELLDLFLFAAVSPDKGNSAGFSLRQELLRTFRLRY